MPDRALPGTAWRVAAPVAANQRRLPEPRTRRLSDYQHRTPGREIGSSGAAARGASGWGGFLVGRRDDVAVDAEVDVGYAMSGDARLAFRVRAGGPHPIVWVAKWFAMQDLETPAPPQRVSGPWFARLLSFATVVSYDRRGTGLSDPVSLADLPTLEALADDLHAVITAAGLDDVVLWAPDEAGPVAVFYAATRPERTRALILVNSQATLARSEGYDAGVTPEDYERFVAWYERDWGTGRVLRAFVPDVSVDDALLRDLARSERRSMPPAVVGAFLRWLYAIDVRAVLPAISAPTLVLHTVENRWVPIAHGRYLARHIPNARLVELPGADYAVFFGSASEEAALGEIEEFVTGTRMAVDHDRMLTTLLFFRRGRLHRPGRRHRRPGLAHGARPPRRRRPPSAGTVLGPASEIHR
jgi:pimeloyl-ACP methyl ester carboxylesterase